MGVLYLKNNSEEKFPRTILLAAAETKVEERSTFVLKRPLTQKSWLRACNKT